MKITSTVLALLLAVFCSAAGELKFSEKSGIYTVEHPAFSCAVTAICTPSATGTACSGRRYKYRAPDQNTILRPFLL